jgi:hypothetical protein
MSDTDRAFKVEQHQKTFRILSLNVWVAIIFSLLHLWGGYTERDIHAVRMSWNPPPPY